MKNNVNSKQIMDDIFAELFCHLDEIDTQIMDNSLNVIKDNYEDVEKNIKKISLTLTKIEKKLKITPINKLKQNFTLRMNSKEVLISR